MNETTNMGIAKKKLMSLFLVIWALGVFFSCKDEKSDPTELIMTDNQINEWIYKEMSTYYLWNHHIPVTPSYSQKPDAFFNSICYWYDKNLNPDGDRFSFIHDNYEELSNELSGISSEEIGFEFSLGILSGDDIFGQVEYVKKNTPAKQEGVKRGQVFTKVNGSQLNRSNYQDLLFGLEGAYTLTLHDVKIQDGYYALADTITKNLGTVSAYKDHPILMDSVYRVEDKNIGYLVYNFFADDSNDQSLSFDIALKQVFEKFQNQHVADLIVDLRYNSGGSMNAALCMASMLVKNRNTSNTFLRAQYNSLLTEAILKDPSGGEKAFYVLFKDKITSSSQLVTDLPCIGSQLTNLVFLTSQNTASAGELVINSLRPYGMNMTLIGDTTVGKNVGSITIQDEDRAEENNWAIQPIIVKYFNAQDQSDFTAGFVPDRLNEDYDLIKIELGSLNESLLADAVACITGKSYPLRSSDLPMPMLKKVDSSIGRKVWSNQIILQDGDWPKIE